MRALAASILVGLSMLAWQCRGAQGREFRVYTCVSEDDRALGPTIGSPGAASGWALESNGLLA